MSEKPEIRIQWYWDRRTRTALYPQRINENTVEFVTIRHREAIADATDAGALVPIENLDLGSGGIPLDLFDSFRMPERLEVVDEDN